MLLCPRLYWPKRRIPVSLSGYLQRLKSMNAVAYDSSPPLVPDIVAEEEATEIIRFNCGHLWGLSDPSTLSASPDWSTQSDADVSNISRARTACQPPMHTFFGGMYSRLVRRGWHQGEICTGQDCAAYSNGSSSCDRYANQSRGDAGSSHADCMSLRTDWKSSCTSPNMCI